MRKEKNMRIFGPGGKILLVTKLLLVMIFASHPVGVMAATDATLQFDQTSLSANVGESVTLVARVNPGTNEVGAVELDVTFNPSILRLDSITRSAPFTTDLFGPVIDNIGTGNTDGNGSIDVGILTTPATYVTTTSNVATFVFTALTPATNSPIGIAATSNASALGDYVVSTRTGATITVAGEQIPPDSTPPSISNGSPSGTLAAGTVTTTVGVTTNEDAVCKYATSTGISFANMTNMIINTGGVTHSFPAAGLSDGSSYSYYIRCQDEVANVNASDYVVSFSISSSASISKDKKEKKESTNKKKESSSERSISNSKRTVARGTVLIQRGKKFSKNSMVELYFSRYGGGYYPPVKVKTSSTGSFRVDYRANKPKGTYGWYAINLETGWKSKVIYYSIK